MIKRDSEMGQNQWRSYKRQYLVNEKQSDCDLFSKFVLRDTSVGITERLQA